MARIPSNDLDEVWAQLMRQYSSVRREIPITKSQLRAFLDIVDTELNAAEIAIVQEVPAGPGKTWLLTNPVIGRDMIVAVMEKRKEVL